MKWDVDGLRAEFRSAIEGGKRHQADLKSRIGKGDPTASKDLHDETLGEVMFAGLHCRLDFISSPGALVQFLITHDPGKIQFLGAYNARVARAAYRLSHKALLIKAEAALR